MKYEGAIYRPPSEAGSFILQVTIGCSHNRCTFCVSFIDKKFRERELKDIFADIEEISAKYPGVERVFLADGNAMVMGTEKLLKILDKLYGSFPRLQRVGLYATPQDLLDKSREELLVLQQAGLGIVYMGVETGNEKLLSWIRKGVTRAEIAEAGIKAREAGLILSATVINGLGGLEKMAEHAADTASLINEIDPHYLGLLTLMVCEGTAMAAKVRRNEFKLPAPLEILAEIKMMVEGLEVSNCIFRANHASNYLPLKGTLPKDKYNLINTLDKMLQSRNTGMLRPEYLRGL
ncbi:MAG: radical SAM protein [Firmicutes bacterium]|nr:radical SAM protein [Bacillota bacterium]